MKKETSKVIFAQGMRRSGTTIFYDLIQKEHTFKCFYEPLAAAKNTTTGGSSIKNQENKFKEVIKARNLYFKENKNLLKNFSYLKNLNFLNYGAPRLAALEFEPDLPFYAFDYIKFLTNISPNIFIKFTRMHSKIHNLYHINPNAKLIHLVRNPKSIVSSYLYGKNRVNYSKYNTEKKFFKTKSNYSAWSSKNFSDFIINHFYGSSFDNIEDFKRILLIWKYNFEKTDFLGQKYFKKNYIILRHEDLISNPEKFIVTTESFLDFEFKSETKKWLIKNIKKEVNIPFEHNLEWNQSFDDLDMTKFLKRCKYI
jgi:hypothetical protein